MKKNSYLLTFLFLICFIGIPQYTYSNTEKTIEKCNEKTLLYSTDSFITKWTVPTDNTQITFPLYFSSGTLSIDWGDGTVESNLGEAPTHTYVTAGTYTVTILAGHIDRIRFGDARSSAPYIVDVMQWGTNAWASTENAFTDCINLDVTASDAPNLSNATRTPGMFFGCSSLVGTTAFNTWDTSTIGDMYSMFFRCTLFNQDLDNWNVSNVTEMRYMFQSASSFNGNISTWNVGNVLLMDGVFAYAHAFNQSLNNWNVSNVKDMTSMFRDAYAFNQALDNWNVSNVETMRGMFLGTENFNQPLNNWNVSNVREINFMFFEAEAFNQPLNNWDVSNVTTMARLFQNCQSFDQNLGSWDISSVVSVSGWDGLNYMFASTGISRENYDNTLIGWSTLDPGETQIPTGIRFNGGNSNYCLGETARQDLINTYNWVITDAGQSCPNINVIVPNVVGVSQTDAETTLINGGLQVSVTETFNPTIPAGTVITQNPISGTSVSYGSIVNIVVSSDPPLIITGIVANTSDFLHVIELYVTSDIPDLSLYAIGVDNDNDGSDGAEYYLTGSATAGDFLYITMYPNVFQDFFGFAPNFDLGGNNALNPSGNDAVELFYDDTNTQVLIDSYGNVGENGNVGGWDYNSSWVYRKTGTGPDGSFVIGNWRIPGANIIIDNDAANTALPVPFPTGTYGQPYDDIAPTAVCQNINFEVNQGTTMVDPSLVDNGSSDNIGIALIILDDDIYNCSEDGPNPVTLTVYDAAGNKDTCTATINVTLATSQVLCQDLAVSLDFNDEATVSFLDIVTGFDGACVAEGSQFYLTTTEPGSGSAGLFNGQTTASSTTDDVFGNGNAQYYESFSFTVPEDGNYLPEFNFSSTATNDLLFAFISDQPVAPNTGDVTSRTGFLNGFVYAAPSSYVGSFNNDDDVFLSSNTTYYLQVVVINQSDEATPSTATFSGGFGEENSEVEDLHTYTTADIGDNTIYAVVIDDIGRMSYCAATVTVTSIDPFVTTWKTDNTGTSNDNQITIPTTGGGYNFQVNWGDGTIQNIIGGNNPTHTYATPGTYTVSITGDFPRIYFDNGGDKQKLLTIEKWGDIQWSSMEEAFYGCENLTIAVDAGVPDLSNVTSMKSMFERCEVMNADLSAWDVSNVEDMQYTFYNAYAFNGNISTWNVSNVTTFSYMFYEAVTFNQPLNSWNTSNVENMEGVFSETESFNQDLNNWDVSNVTTMYEMFDTADVFNGDISSWNVSNVENMEEMFYAAYAFNQDISGWNIANVENMQDMFNGAGVFNQDISNWNVSSVTNMHGMFSGADAFNQDIGAWNVSNVTNMSDMFRSADNFDQELGDWDLTSIVDTGSSSSGLRNMFGSGPSGIALSVSNYDNTLLGWNDDSSGIPTDGIDDIPSNIIFGGGKSKYCNNESDRQNLIDTHDWTINDQGKDCPLKFQIKVLLQGASLNANGGSLNLMRDELRQSNLIPLVSPYDGVTTCEAEVFDNTDEEGIIDWIEVELRDAADNTNILFTGSFLIQRDGFIVNTDLSILQVEIPDGDYYVAVKHRNHLGIMSATPISLNDASVTTINFTDGSVPTYGTNAQTSFGMPSGVLGMWAGNVNSDAIIQYSGTNPDSSDILSEVLNDPGNTLNFPTYAVSGYKNHDINMDGTTQYTGTNPNTPIILQNVLAHPDNFLSFSTYQIIEQLPEND